jgi:hypothetical protein
MIYHDLTSKGSGMPKRTGIPLSAGVPGRKNSPFSHMMQYFMQHLISQPEDKEVRYDDS